MSLTRTLRFTGSLIADHWVHRWPYDDARQSIPLLAGERVKLRRRRQTSGESASLDLEVLLGVVPLLVLAFTLMVVIPVRAANAFSAGLAPPARARCALFGLRTLVFSAGLAAPAGARCAALGLRTLVLIFCFGHCVTLQMPFCKPQAEFTSSTTVPACGESSLSSDQSGEIQCGLIGPHWARLRSAERTGRVMPDVSLGIG
jgi:hypothetical protein